MTGKVRDYHEFNHEKIEPYRKQFFEISHHFKTLTDNGYIERLPDNYNQEYSLIQKPSNLLNPQPEEWKNT